MIPKVVRVVMEGQGRRPFNNALECPVCGSEVVRPENEVVSRCINSSCKARLKESIQHFTRRSAMDIDGVGERLAGQFVDRGLVRNIADLYGLRLTQLAELEKDSALDSDGATRLTEAIMR